MIHSAYIDLHFRNANKLFIPRNDPTEMLTLPRLP